MATIAERYDRIARVLSCTSKYTVIMEHGSRHQCLIYEGPPSRQLRGLAEIARRKLAQSHRCLYLNSPAMVTGMRSYLAAAGVDVAAEIARTNLVMTSAQNHAADDGRFDIKGMIRGLSDTLQRALADGYAGLWATADMTWEFGPEKDFFACWNTSGGSKS